MVAAAASALAVLALGAGSVTWTREAKDRMEIDGTACGQQSSASVDLPPGAFDVTVHKPTVGTTEPEARVTAVDVQGSKVTVTAVGTCDPNDPEAQQWTSAFDYRIGYRTRATVAVQRDWARRAPYFVVKPSSVRIEFIGAVEHIRWQSYGGATAVGFGKLNEDSWPDQNTCRHAKCLGNHERYKVVLRNPSYCAGDDKHVFYGRMSWITTHKVGVLKPGTEQWGYKLKCGIYSAIPIH